jgi:hypothetical protein
LLLLFVLLDLHLGSEVRRELEQSNWFVNLIGTDYEANMLLASAESGLELHGKVRFPSCRNEIR